MKSKFPFPTLVVLTIACLLVMPVRQFFPASTYVHAQGQTQTAEQGQSNETAGETLTFKGSYGLKRIDQPSPQSDETTLPDGTEFTVVTAEEITSKTASEGDPLNLKVLEDVRVNGQIVIARGTLVKGVVASAKKAGMMGRGGNLEIRIESTTTVDNQRIRLRASRGKEGEGKKATTAALAMVFGPVGLLKHGSDAKIKAGTQIKVYTDEEKMVQLGARNSPRQPIAIAETRINPPSPSTGFYAETQSDFDTLDGVTVNASKGTLVLFGHRARSGPPRSVPYLDYLAAALESNNPTFSLEWTPESRQSIDRAFSMSDQTLTNRLAGTMDSSGHLTKRGEWWYRTLGVNVQEGMDKMSLWTAVFPVAGYPDAGKVMKAVDEVERAGAAANQKMLDPDGNRRSPLEHFFNATTGLVVPFDQNFLNTYAAALNGDEEARETFFSWALRGLARAYKLEENHYLDRYQSLKRSGNAFGIALEKTLEMSQDDTVAVQTNAFHALVGNRTFIHIPPDIMRDVLGINPVVVPVYEGLPANSLLARVAFDADVFGKNLMDMPEVKSDVPSYRTYFEWRQTVGSAPAAEGHTWFAPDRFELIESADGGTVRFGKTPIRIYMERYDRGTGASDRKSVEDPLLKQYADELTALYDPLAAKFPVLLDLRESMKVMAIADWLKEKRIKLSFPAAGRSVWNPPAQFPGVINMEIAVKEAPVGEVMSASGGIDFRVDKNWNLTKQRIEEQPGPPPANATTVDFDPASGVVASASSRQIDRVGMPSERVSAADGQKTGTTSDFKVSSFTTNIFSCYRIDATKSGCLEIRNNSTRRVRLYVESLPGVQCTVDAGSYCTVPIAVGAYHLRIVADDERGVGPTIGADVDLTSAGARLTLSGGTP